jgi:CubicO group peptidase (beta-lactamase class C family)
MSRLQFQMDRRSGMPAAHCCLRALARNLLGIGELLRNDGTVANGKQVLPAGWVRQMLAGSRANPEFGLQIVRVKRGELEIWHLGEDRGGAIWIVPSAGLTVVALADRDVRLGDAWLEPVLGAVRK